MRTRLEVSSTPYAGASSRLTVVADEARRLTPRDRWLLDLLAEHQTLTTDQVTALGFGSSTRARERLGLLRARGVLDRFRHYQRPGSQSWRWTIGPVGAAIVAAGSNQPAPRPAAVREATDRLSLSPTLAHLVGVNGFFVALVAYARTRDEYTLARWWSERQATRECGGKPRPDGHGVWVAHGRAVPFWVEYDTGTERPPSRLSGKLGDYAALPRSLAYPVLFWLPSAVRESNVTAYLSRVGVPPGVTVATAAADHAADHGGPAGPVWAVHRRPGRVRLGELPTPAPYRGDGAPWES